MKKLIVRKDLIVKLKKVLKKQTKHRYLQDFANEVLYKKASEVLNEKKN